MANLDIIRGRQVILTLTNRSGGAVNEGDVVIVDIANDESFTTTVNTGSILVVGVVQEDIANLAAGRVLVEGYAAIVEVNDATARGDFLKTSGVATRATSQATMDQGVFATALSATGAAGQVSAVLFGVDSGGAASQSFANEVMNFPSIDRADGTQPEWWEEEGANATLTEEDVVGEGITETWERCLKVVTTADSYAYQRYTYATQPRIKSGRTLSALVAVWAVGGVTARVRLQSSVGSLGVATTVAAAWTLLRVEGVTLDGVQVDLRLEANNGTAYFVPLGVCIGSSAAEFPPRGLMYKEYLGVAIAEDLNASGGKAWADVDLTALTGNRAAMIEGHIFMHCNVAGQGFEYSVRRNGDARNGGEVRVARVWENEAREANNSFGVICDDGQIIETELALIAGAGVIQNCRLWIRGWWEWE